MPVLLGEKDVRVVLSMDDLIAAMETALDQFSGGGVRQPLRSIVPIGDGHAFYGVMPAYIGTPPALGTKLVSVYHTNAALGLPSHLATIVLHDPETGALQAIIDGIRAEGNFALVIDLDNPYSQNIVSYDKSLDITDRVVRRLLQSD